jgi:hypothetical protein
MHTAKPLVPEPNPFEVEIAVEKLKRYKSPDIDQSPAELQARGNILCSEITDLLILLGKGKNCHNNGRNSLLNPFINRMVQSR